MHKEKWKRVALQIAIPVVVYACLAGVFALCQSRVDADYYAGLYDTEVKLGPAIFYMIPTGHIMEMAIPFQSINCQPQSGSGSNRRTKNSSPSIPNIRATETIGSSNIGVKRPSMKNSGSIWILHWNATIPIILQGFPRALDRSGRRWLAKEPITRSSTTLRQTTSATSISSSLISMRGGSTRSTTTHDEGSDGSGSLARSRLVDGELEAAPRAFGSTPAMVERAGRRPALLATPLDRVAAGSACSAACAFSPASSPAGNSTSAITSARWSLRCGCRTRARRSISSRTTTR